MKIQRKNAGLNMSNQLILNSAIFKDNLKVISGILSWLTSREDLEGGDKGRKAKGNPKGGFPGGTEQGKRHH